MTEDPRCCTECVRLGRCDPVFDSSAHLLFQKAKNLHSLEKTVRFKYPESFCNLFWHLREKIADCSYYSHLDPWSSTACIAISIVFLIYLKAVLWGGKASREHGRVILQEQYSTLFSYSWFYYLFEGTHYHPHDPSILEFHIQCTTLA